MRRKRIAVLGVSRLLGDLISSTLAGEPDLELVYLSLEDPRNGAAALEVRADFVIAGLDGDHLPDPWLDVLERLPRTRVLALRGDGTNGILWQIRPERIPLGQLSPDSLLAAIRTPDWRETTALR